MKVTDMTTAHIVNRIAWLKRNMPDHWDIHGDELPDGSVTRALINDDIEHYEKQIEALEKELDSRNVNLTTREDK